MYDTLVYNFVYLHGNHKTQEAMKRPFVYGELAEKGNFVDRVEDRKQLKSFLANGINVMLISPRRWGKSSLVRQAMSELTVEDQHVRVCYVDAFSVNSATEFLNAFASAVIEGTSSTLEKRFEDIKRFINVITPSFTVTDEAMHSFSLDLKVRSLEQSAQEILRLPETIAQAKQMHVIVCIDEFQQLATLPDWKSLEGKMRSEWQLQHNTTYCFYGSKRHMMIDIFGNAANPFYRFGQVLFLKKIAREYWIPYIEEGFRSTGKHISTEMAGRICDVVKCHSWYVQQLSFFIWTATDDEVTEEVFSSQLQLLIDTNAPMFMSDSEGLTASQIGMLAAVSNGETKLSSKAVVGRYSLGNMQAITRNKRRLQELDIIEPQGEGFVFVDEVYELWFRQQYQRLVW
jgi:hypothetical protein